MMKIRRTIAFLTLLTIAAVVAAPSALAEETTFSDGAADAYRLPGTEGSPPSFQAPNPLLSDPSADILEVGFAHVAGKGGPNHVTYAVSMTITGPADADYSYVAAGQFGEDCQLYHFLTPGITSFANAFCGSGETRRFVGRISGTDVVQSGETLSATYTLMTKKIFSEVAADRELGPLFAFTCVSGLEGLGCRSEEVLDFARSTGSFRI